MNIKFRGRKKMNIKLTINKIKNINHAELELPMDSGLYAFVGGNGCGKSTLMLALSLMVKTSSAHMLASYDISNDSIIDIETETTSDHWHYKKGKLTTDKFSYIKGHGSVKGHSALIASTHIDGFYEGSIFYGCRFDDFDCIDKFMANKSFEDYLTPADDFVAETLGYILHNDKKHYRTLKKIRSRHDAEELGFKGVPYFLGCGLNTISQFRMSSGESMLISLIDFINNLVIKNTRRRNKLLFLIDEVELALHPSAIDRLVLFLQDLVKKSTSEMIIYFSTHSAELIHRLNPRNIYLLENDNGELTAINPCYPNYAVRNLYVPNGFDFLLLVEDELAKTLVEKTIRVNNLSKSKLCCILPSGGCTQMLKLHYDIVTYNTLGIGKQVISIYDGDAKEEINKKEDYAFLRKCFLPVQSIEKYLKEKCIIVKDKAFVKLLGDKYFTQRSLDDIIADYRNDSRTVTSKDNDGKNFYKVLLSNLYKIGITEKDFIKYLCDDIFEYEDMSNFSKTLERLLE